MLIRQSLITLTSLIIVSLAGCGGGSGGPKNTSGPRDPEPQNPLSQTPAQLKQSYSNYADALYTGSTAHANISLETVRRVVDQTISRNNWDLPFLGSIVWDTIDDSTEKTSFATSSEMDPLGISQIIKHVRQSGSSKTEVNDTFSKAINESLNCYISGTVTLTGDLDNEGIGSVAVDYSECVNEASQTLNGRVVLSYEATGTIFFDYGAYFHNLSISADASNDYTREDHTLSGYWHIIDNDQSYTITKHVLYSPLSGSPQYLLETETTTETTSYTSEVTGRIHLEDIGYLEVASNRSLESIMWLSGIVSFVGSDNVRAAIDISNDLLRYLVDDDNDGEFDRGTYIGSLESFVDDGDITLVAINDMNLPPRIFSSPSFSRYPAPTTSDSITVGAPSVYDDDTPIEELTITFEWRINGDIVEGVTGDTLPAGSAVFGDTITVATVVSDGTTTVTSNTRTITLADAPSSAVIADYPAAIAPGETLSFAVSYTDPDSPETALSAVLAYGPAGMTIDSEGLVQWQAISPLFGSAVVAFGIQDAQNPEGEITELTVTIESPDSVLPIARNGILRPTEPQSMLIGDFTGDSRQEIVMTDNQRRLQIVSFENDRYQEIWSYPYALSDNGNLKLEAVQFDDDAKEEVLIIAPKAVYLLDDITSRIRQLYETSGRIFSAQIIDSDNDSIVELALLESSSSYSNSEKTLRVIELNDVPSHLFTAALGSTTQRLIAGNVDDDAAIELVTNDGFVYDTSTWTNEWYYSAGFGRNNIALGDLDNNGVAEIIGTNSANELSVFSADTKTVVGTSGAIDSCGFFVYNIDADDAKELISASCSYSNAEIVAYDLVDTELSETWRLAPTASTRMDADSFIVGDPDGDGTAEVVVTDTAGRYNSTIGSFSVASTASDATEFEYQSTSTDHPGPIQAIGWAQTSPGTEHAIFVTNDVNNNYGGQHLISMDVNGEYTLSDEISANSNGSSAALSDFNNDGYAEIFLSTGSGYSYNDLSVLQINDLTEHWNSGELTSNVSMISAIDVNDDGSDDAVFVDGNIIRIIDVSNEALLDSFNTGQSIADISLLQTEDGLLIATCSYQSVSIWRKEGSTYSIVANVTEDCDHVAFGNIDSDAPMELVIAEGNYWSRSQVISYDFQNDELTEISNVSLPGYIHDFVFDTSQANNQSLLAGIRTDRPNSSDDDYAVVSFSPTSDAFLWSSPALPTQVKKNSMVYRSEPDASHRLMFSTASTMYLVQ